jgi:hypothetical protein
MGTLLVLSMALPHTLVAGEGNERYVVKRYDTLWDLSRRFLGDPYDWQRIWQTNTHIHNPHRIYPGDPLTIPGGQAAYASRGAASIEEVRANFREAVRGLPAVGGISGERGPIEEGGAPVAEDSIGARARELARGGRFGAEHLAQIAFLWTSRDAKGLVAPGDALIDEEESRAFQLFESLPLELFGPHRFAVGDTVDIFDLIDYLRFEGAVVNLVKRVGRARVERVEGERAEAKLLAAWDVVRGKDRIAPVERRGGLSIERVVDAATALRGRVVVRVEQSETPQLYQTFLIDRGERDGVRMGDIFAAGPAGAPVLRGCVMHVGERSSTLMVMRLSGHRLEPGDSVALVKRMDFREER